MKETRREVNEREEQRRKGNEENLSKRVIQTAEVKFP